jgi:N-acetylglucosaminyl-diphospho-decaprenol L-rhamnosyltransferase
MPSLDIVVVNWNAGHQLRACIESVLNVDKRAFQLKRVVVVDNASIDGSVEELETLQQNIPLIVIQNPKNYGFAVASNQGAKDSTADYLLLLNPDTRLFKESLNTPIEFMEKLENKEVGIVGIQHVN